MDSKRESVVLKCGFGSKRGVDLFRELVDSKWRLADSRLRNNQHIEKPKNFERMKEIAEELSKDFPHVRVDFFNVNGEIIFGELTFYNASGYTRFTPDEFDYKLGEKLIKSI